MQRRSPFSPPPVFDAGSDSDSDSNNNNNSVGLGVGSPVSIPSNFFDDWTSNFDDHEEGAADTSSDEDGLGFIDGMAEARALSLAAINRARDWPTTPTPRRGSTRNQLRPQPRYPLPVERIFLQADGGPVPRAVNHEEETTVSNSSSDEGWHTVDEGVDENADPARPPQDLGQQQQQQQQPRDQFQDRVHRNPFQFRQQQNWAAPPQQQQHPLPPPRPVPVGHRQPLLQQDRLWRQQQQHRHREGFDAANGIIVISSSSDEEGGNNDEDDGSDDEEFFANNNLAGHLAPRRVVFHDPPVPAAGAEDGRGPMPYPPLSRGYIFRNGQVPDTPLDVIIPGWLNDPRLDSVVDRMRDLNSQGNVYAATRFNGQHSYYMLLTDERLFNRGSLRCFSIVDGRERAAFAQLRGISQPRHRKPNLLTGAPGYGKAYDRLREATHIPGNVVVLIQNLSLRLFVQKLEDTLHLRVHAMVRALARIPPPRLPQPGAADNLHYHRHRPEGLLPQAAVVRPAPPFGGHRFFDRRDGFRDHLDVPRMDDDRQFHHQRYDADIEDLGDGDDRHRRRLRRPHNHN